MVADNGQLIIFMVLHSTRNYISAAYILLTHVVLYIIVICISCKYINLSRYTVIK